MTSNDLRPEYFIDFHSHAKETHSDMSYVIYSYNPGINEVLLSRPFSCGIHPWEIKQDFSEIEKLASHENCCFIGETGLDRVIDTSLEIQKNLFLRHIQLSESVKKPLVIHCVKAFDQLFKIHKETRPTMPWIIHDFNGGEDIINKARELNLYYSLGSRLIRSPQSKLVKNLNALPLDKIFFETDDQVDFDIESIYAKFSELTKVDLTKLKRQIFSNYKSLF